MPLTAILAHPEVDVMPGDITLPTLVRFDPVTRTRTPLAIEDATPLERAHLAREYAVWLRACREAHDDAQRALRRLELRDLNASEVAG